MRFLKPSIIFLGLICLLFACNTPSKIIETPVLETAETVLPPLEEIDSSEAKIPKGVERANYGIILPTPAEKVEARVEPPFWWAGMKNTKIELLIHDKMIQGHQVKITHPGVQILKVHKADNPNYLFVELDLKNAQVGDFNIELSKGNDLRKYPYSIFKREKDGNRIKGLNSSDFIYLLMPDRFANGDKSNDVISDMKQNVINRDRMYYRHGGDLEGIRKHLDYLQDLGVTALWLNPIIENDQAYESYHGYAQTEHYEIDPRFGSNEEYLLLVEECHKRGMKVIKDIIHNHVGDQHWFIQDLPYKDWIHQYDSFTRTTYRAPTLMDAYASNYDKNRMSNAWFDHHMPDLNQKNPHLAKYLIQNNIWWIEYAGLDAYRIDTYAYPDQEFMAQWGKAIQDEYPQFGMFAETWVHGPSVQAQFTQNNNLREGYNSYMPGVTDFQLHYAINEALSKKQGWTEGVSRIYYTLAQDFLYENPNRNVVFLDNHDLSRFYSMIGEDINKFKSGISFLLTTRGIPMIYYGTEILMKNYTDPDGKVRADFPGGWEGDSINKFKASGRTDLENEAFNHIRNLARYRKNNPVLQTGKLTQFVPENGIYVYFRHDEGKRVMIIMNVHEEATEHDMSRYSELTTGYSKGKNISTGEVLENIKNIRVEGYTTLVLELM